ncbi:hypothetical protein Tco_1386512 [Tanacetum coccineum]
MDHRVTKLIAENEHLKQTYKQLYDSIKPARIRSKEQCDDLINQVNIKSVEISDLNARLQEKVLVITALKNDLRKLKGKDLADNVVTQHTIDPEMLKTDVEYLNPRLLNNRSVHSNYIKHTQEEAVILREIVEQGKSQNPLNTSLDSACKYTKQIQELLVLIGQTCPRFNNSSEKLVAVTPKNKDKRVRFTKPVTSSRYIITKTAYTSNIVSNKPMLSSTGVKPSTSASGSQPSCNTKKDKIRQTPTSTQKNKVEAHPRKVKSSLKNKDCVVEPKGTAHVQNSKLNANSELKCVKGNGCMLYNNHDLCVLDFINNVNARNKSKSVMKSSKRKVWKPTGKVFTNIRYIWRPTGRTFTIVGNACPLTRITITTEVPRRKPPALENETPKLVVTLVYSRKPKKSKTNVPISNSKVVQIILWYLDSGRSKHMTGDRSPLTNFVNKFLVTVKFGNDHVAKILGYGDYHIGNVTILRVYYVEGLGYNLFSVGQFCDSNLEVAFRQHTCFIRNLEGVYLLTGSRGNNLYTLSLGDMMASSPISGHGLVRGLPKLNFEKDHLCSACAMGKSKKKAHKPKSEDTNQEKLYLLHMDLYGPMRVTCVNDTLTAELERYKEQVKVLNEGQNVDLTCKDNVSDSCAQSVEIDRLKQTLSEYLKEKESLMQKVSLFKDDFKKEESRNIDREITLENRIKQLDNIVFKRNQSAQTVHVLMKPQFFYDHTTKQALGFQNPFYLKKAQQLEPKLYVGDIIEKTNPIVIPDSEETLMLAEESRSKMFLKQKDPIMLEKKVNTTPVDYAALNQLYKDFETRFVPQTELSAKQAFWSQNSVNSLEPILSSSPTIVDVPKELLKVSMANTSLKKLKPHLAGFDMVVKERTTPIAITKDIVNIIVNSSVNNPSVTVHECEKCLQLETELQTDFIEKEIYDKLFKGFTTLEKHCISLEVYSQLNQEIFHRDNSVSNQSAPSFDQLFELNELKAQSQVKDTVIKKLKERIKALSRKKNENKIKQELEEIKIINIELDHRVTKLIAENEHLKQTYKQLYVSIKPARKVLVITALKNDLRKLKGKDLADNAVTQHTIDPEMLKIDVEYLNPRLLNNRSVHSNYIKHTQEEATILREIVEQGK